jgi:hypothetical protein
MPTYLPKIRIALCLFLIIASLILPGLLGSKSVRAANSVSAESKKWSWLGSIGALCENVGVNGAYRANVEAEVEKIAGGKLKITSMAAYVSGALIDKDTTTSTTKLEIKKGTQLVSTVILSRPDSEEPSIEVNPEAGQSYRLYLPKSQPSIEIPAGAKIFFTVTAQLNSPSGACSLGVSKKTIDPFEDE